MSVLCVKAGNQIVLLSSSLRDYLSVSHAVDLTAALPHAEDSTGSRNWTLGILGLIVQLLRCH